MNTAARRALDVFDYLLAMTLASSTGLSHLPLNGGYDEPKTLSFQITLIGPIGADVRQAGIILKDQAGEID